MKKARRTSAGAPLVSESDTEESRSEVGGIAIQVREGHTICMFPHDKGEHKGRERTSSRRNAFKKGIERTRSSLMRRHKRTNADTDHQAWMTRIWG